MTNFAVFIPIIGQIIFPTPTPAPEGFAIYTPPPIIRQIKPRTYAVKDLGFNPCSCISFLKYKSGISQDVPIGNAWDIRPNTKTPKVGAWVLTYEGQGHAALLINWSEEHYTVEDFNFISCAKSVRTLNRNSPVIKGLFLPEPGLSVIKTEDE